MNSYIKASDYVLIFVTIILIILAVVLENSKITWLILISQIILILGVIYNIILIQKQISGNKQLFNAKFEYLNDFIKEANTHQNNNISTFTNKIIVESKNQNKLLEQEIDTLNKEFSDLSSQLKTEILNIAIRLEKGRTTQTININKRVRSTQDSIIESQNDNITSLFESLENLKFHVNESLQRISHSVSDLNNNDFNQNKN